MALQAAFLSLFSLLSLLTGRDTALLLFAGDAMQHDAQLQSAARGGGLYSYAGCYDSISEWIREADLAVVNLETPLGGKPYSGYPCFCAPDTFLGELANAGFDLFLTANNHTLDRRDRGLRRTIEQFEQRNLPFVGIYRDSTERADRVPLIHTVNGIRIAFLNYTYGTNGIRIQGDVVVNYIDWPRIRRDVEQSRKNGAELIVVAPHWGEEYNLLPDKNQQALADSLVELGVDMIVGSHPHVIQPMEIRRSEKLDKNILLVYSLGNFVSAMKRVDTRGGAVVRVVVGRDSTGRAAVLGADRRLVFTMPDGADGGKGFRVIDASKPPKGVWGERCREFVRRAENIFDRHNINVPSGF